MKFNTLDELKKHLANYDKAFVEDYLRFGSEARAASIWALKDKYDECKKKNNESSKKMFIPLIIQEFYMLLEQVEAVSWGFIQRDNDTMLYTLLSYESNPTNFQGFSTRFITHLRRTIVAVLKSEGKFNDEEKEKLKKTLEAIKDNVDNIAQMAVGLRGVFNKIKHQFVVVEMQSVFNMTDTTFPGAIRLEEDKTGKHEAVVSNMNFSDETIERIFFSTRSAVGLMQEVLAGYLKIKY